MTLKQKEARVAARMKRYEAHLAMVAHPFFKVRLAMRYKAAYDLAVRDYRAQMEHAHALR